ncbi:hypothetical protein M9Y10_021518 [Tritrichomonas musculus]|uniref:Uncharacterized protein n=1 Tax=Tritrichomonas musculus TaxID=1915356 RepID=A0ABR2KQK5_9EUKA
MEWPIEIDLGQGTYADVFLSFRVNFGELIMDYYDSTKEQFILDQLSSFQRVEFDDSNPLHISFIGNKVKRSFKFKDEDALSNVWSYLQNYVKFQSISGRDRAYTIVPVKKFSSDKLDHFAEDASAQKKSVLGKELVSVPEAITSKIILESMPDFELINVDENNYQNIFRNDGIIKDEYNMSRVQIKFDFVFNLWKSFFGINPSENDFDDYKKLLSQWNPIYSSKWQNNLHLRRFVALFENDLKNSYFTFDLRKLTFEILMSCMLIMHL